MSTVIYCLVIIDWKDEKSALKKKGTATILSFQNLLLISFS